MLRLHQSMHMHNVIYAVLTYVHICQ